MKPAAPFYPWDEHLAIDLPGALAVFTTRRGGFSTGPYASLNLGRLTDDDPEAVDRNRGALQARVDGRLAMIRQVHGSRVLRLEEVPDGSEGTRVLVEADGQAGALPGLAPVVLTADCLPIAVAGRCRRDAARRLAGAGRPDRFGGVRAVRELAGDGTLVAAIGPGAGGCCYEVGEEVHRHFSTYGEDVHRAGNLDLKAIARAQLERAGVDAVHDVGLCTICSAPELFFSHRRDHGVTGRQAGSLG